MRVNKVRIKKANLVSHNVPLTFHIINRLGKESKLGNWSGKKNKLCSNWVWGSK
jgi:hypothetical protein